MFSTLLPCQNCSSGFVKSSDNLWVSKSRAALLVGDVLPGSSFLPAVLTKLFSPRTSKSTPQPTRKFFHDSFTYLFRIWVCMPRSRPRPSQIFSPTNDFHPTIFNKRFQWTISTNDFQQTILKYRFSTNDFDQKIPKSFKTTFQNRRWVSFVR